MQIDNPTTTEYTEFLGLVDAEIRPHRAKTHAWDDFPLILHANNRSSILVYRTSDQKVGGGIAALIREFTTNYGTVKVAGIGSVVTRPQLRGQGISRELQLAMLEELKRQGVPLAVLWTDQPELYAGRGFFPAGWEFHLDLAEAVLPDVRGLEARVRPLASADIAAVEQLYQLHPCRTLRCPGDAKALYLMPGTQGLVLERDVQGVGRAILAAIFCGKGADFSHYVTEWNGEANAVLQLLGYARDAGLASQILVPAGEEAFAESLVNSGAGWEIKPSGFWNVLDPKGLWALSGNGVAPVASLLADPRYWLGGIDAEGAVQPGLMKIGIWGFDSV